MSIQSTAQEVTVLELDPFSDEFLNDPYEAHEQMREAGPVFWLERYHLDMIRAGAALAQPEQVRLREINQELSSLGCILGSAGVLYLLMLVNPISAALAATYVSQSWPRSTARPFLARTRRASATASSGSGTTCRTLSAR